MTMRSAIRYFGLVHILFIFIVVGFQLISNPAPPAALLAKSNFPKMLKMVGVEYRLSSFEYMALIQLSGSLFLGSSLFVLLGVGRCFFSLILALSTIVITVAFHVNLTHPTNVSNAELFHLLKNVSIIGALFFVAGSGQRSQRYSKASRESLVEKKNR